MSSLPTTVQAVSTPTRPWYGDISLPATGECRTNGCLGLMIR